MLEVRHRPDNLLQKSVERGVPQGAEGTFISEVTVPVHKALLGFLNAGVVGRHANRAALEEILEQWPEYAAARGVNVDVSARDFKRLWINRKKAIAAASGMGGDFEIASIHEV